MAADRRKRILTLFDEKEPDDIRRDDIIFTNDRTYSREGNKVYHLALLDASDQDVSLYEEQLSFFADFPQEYGCLANNIYFHFFRQLFHVICQLNEIIAAEGIDQIVLVGGADFQFITLNDAEGEGVKHHYRSSWLYNSFLYQYYQKKQGICVSWLHKKNAGLQKLRFVFRENYYFYRYMLMMCAKRILPEKKGNDGSLRSGKKLIVSFADLELQYKHLRSKLRESELYDSLLVLGRSIRPDKADAHLFLPSNSFGQIIRAVIRIKGLVKKQKRTFHIMDGSIQIDLKRLYQGCAAGALRAYLREEAIQKCIRKIGKDRIACILTDKTLGYEICTVHHVAEELSIPHTNIQLVAMAPILYPKLKLADRYYLYAKQTYELYRQYSDSYRFYIPMETKEREIKRTEGRALKLVLFTQPDSYTKRYLEAIRQLAEVLGGSDISAELIVKLHYRQDKQAEFEKLEKEYGCLSIVKTGNAGELMKQCDAILSMTSSVLFEAVTNRIPGFIINFDRQDEKMIYQSGTCVPEVNYIIEQPEELVTLLSDFDRLQTEYRQRLKDYLCNMPGGNTIDEWVQFETDRRNIS